MREPAVIRGRPASVEDGARAGAPAPGAGRAHPERAQLTPDAVLALSRTAGNRAVAQVLRQGGRAGGPRRLQRCPYCTDALCRKGERCGRNPEHGGLFPPGTQSRLVGSYNQAKKDSKKNVREAEHMMPAQAWDVSGLPYNYGQLPAMSIVYPQHRGGVSGFGGGVTSTGSSHTATGWSRLLGALLGGGNREEAFRLAATDEYNAADMTGNLNDSLVSQILGVLNLHEQRQDLTAQQAGRIRNAIMNRWLDAQPRSSGTPTPATPSRSSSTPSPWLLILLVALLAFGAYFLLGR